MKLNDLRIETLKHIIALQARYGLTATPSQLKPNDRRVIGTFWEVMFCRLAYVQGRHFTPVQISTAASGLNKSAQWYGTGSNGKSCYLLPDVVIWTSPGEHHEIKHKDPFVMNNKGPVFGLEKYRLDALLDFAAVTKQAVLYTIHNHALGDGNLATRNDINHWITADITLLQGHHVYQQEKGKTLYNGGYEEKCIFYWPVDMWRPLAEHWVPSNQ